MALASASEFVDLNHNVSWYAGGGLVRRFDLPINTSRRDVGLIGFAMHRENDNRGGYSPVYCR